MKDQNTLRDILARELYIEADAGTRDEWYTEPERRRDYYRGNAQVLIENLAVSEIDVCWRL